jgi:hypothetical protein
MSLALLSSPGDERCMEGGMIRYGFNIRTRTGQRVDNISIMAGSLADAERRLRQMYLQCQIVDCREQAVPRRLEQPQVGGGRVFDFAVARTPRLKTGTH